MSADRSHGTSTDAVPAQTPRDDGEEFSAMGVPIGASVAKVRELTRLGVRMHHVSSRRSGLSPADLSAVSILVRTVIGPAELARLLDVSTAAATGIVDRLVARDLVERRPIEGDRRRTALHITDKGRAKHARYLRTMVEGLEGIEADFAPDEIAMIVRYLERAVDVITHAVETDPPPAD